MNQKDYKKKIHLANIYIYFSILISIGSMFIVDNIWNYLVKKLSYDTELGGAIVIVSIAMYAMFISVIIGFGLIERDFWRKKYNFYLTDKDILEQDIKEVFSLTEKLYNDTKKDIENIGIDLQTIDSIQKRIKELEKKLLYLDERFYDIAKMKLIEIHDKNEIENLEKSKSLLKRIYREGQGVKQINYSLIKEWLKHHSQELDTVKKSVEVLKDELVGSNNKGKIALESQEVRLQSYIESINNLVK